MKTKKTIKYTFAFLSLASISGFTEFLFKDNVYEENQATLDRIRVATSPSHELTGLQTLVLKPYKPYKIVGNGDFNDAVDDPFVVKPFVRKVGQEDLLTENNNCKSNCGDGPPIAHTPFFLESYDLNQLEMTGSLTNDGQGKIALIKTPDAGIVHAALGEYIGQNNGLILAINREGIIIREKYRSPQGWQDRMATLPLIRN